MCRRASASSTISRSAVVAERAGRLLQRHPADLLDLVVVVLGVAFDELEQEERDRLADRAALAPVPVARLAELFHRLADEPVSSRTSRVAASTRLSPGSTWPLGSASTREPSAARRVGTIVTT